MEFDTDYEVQQVQSRTRAEKVLNKDRDAIEKARLAARHEHYERHNIIDNIIKPEDQSSLRIDDVDRFNRDYTQDQRATKAQAHDLMLRRAAARHEQHVWYEKAIEERRRQEEEDAAKVSTMCAEHDFNQESVLYNPVTNEVPDESTQRGMTQKGLDTRKEFLREARAKRIQHHSNSTQYDPITGEPRKFW